MSTNFIGTAATTAMSVTEVSSAVQLYLQQKAMLMSTIQDDTYLIGPGAASYKIPRSAGFEVKSKVSNQETDVQSLSYNADTVNLDKHRYIQFAVEEIAESQSVPRVVADAALKATADLAYDVDKFIKEQFDSASASSPDHKVNFTGSTIVLGDILEIRRLLIKQKIDPRECFLGVGPLREKEMLALDNFIDASKYGANEPIMNGEIGKIYGMRTIMSNVFENDAGTISNVYGWHPTSVSIGWQRRLTFQEESSLRNLGRLYSLDYRYGTGVLDSGKRVVQMSAA